MNEMDRAREFLELIMQSGVSIEETLKDLMPIPGVLFFLREYDMWILRKDRAVTPPPAKEVCPQDCMYLTGRFCVLGANHCSRTAEDFYRVREAGDAGRD